MTRADLIRILMNTQLQDHRNLTREQARAVVNEVFRAIAEALRNEEDVRFPWGVFRVYEQDRKPLRGWFLNRVRVLYKQRNMIKFLGGEYDLEPDQQQSHTLDSKGQMKPSESNLQPPKLSPSERRKLVEIGIKAGKSRRLIAQELNVTEATIRRDLRDWKVQGIPANKKPTATRRKPAAVWKGSSPQTPERKVASQNPARPHKPTPRIVALERLKPRPPKHRSRPETPLSPEFPLGPEELRQRRLEEMLPLVQSWLREQDHNYIRATNVLDKARNLLAKSPDGRLPESPMNADQLLHHTRPQEMDAASSQGLFRREEICALWLARCLAAWAPKDEQLRNDVLNQARASLSR